MKKSGVGKKRLRALFPLGIVAVFLLFGLVAFTQSYRQTQDVARIKEEGTLVVAHVAEVIADDDEGTRYYTRYLYTDSAGKTYTGSTGQKYASFTSAEEHLGEEIRIYILDGESIRETYPVQTGAYAAVRIVLWSAFFVDIGAIVCLLISVLVSRAALPEEQKKPISKGAVVRAAILFGIFGCLGAFIAGLATGHAWLVYAALIVLFGGSFLASIVLLVVMWRRAGKPRRKSGDAATSDDARENKSIAGDAPTDGEVPADRRTDAVRAQAAAQIEEINSTYGYENSVAQAEFMLSQIKHNYRASDRKSKIAGGVFLGALLLLFVGIPVFFSLRIYWAGIVCFCGFGGTIIVSLIVVSIKQHSSLRGRGYTEPVQQGRVTACTLSSTTSTGSEHRQRLTSVIYRIALDVDGEEKIAYTRVPYAEGDTVSVRCHSRRKSAARIVEDEEPATDAFADVEARLSAREAHLREREETQPPSDTEEE